MAESKRLPPVHPGEVLREDFLKPMGLTPYAVAQACGVPRTRIERLAREETPVMPIPRFGSHVTSAPPPAFGWGFKHSTI